MSTISCTLLPGGAFSVFYEGRMELSEDLDVSIMANKSMFTVCCFALFCLGGGLRAIQSWQSQQNILKNKHFSLAEQMK